MAEEKQTRTKRMGILYRTNLPNAKLLSKYWYFVYVMKHDFLWIFFVQCLISRVIIDIYLPPQAGRMRHSVSIMWGNPSTQSSNRKHLVALVSVLLSIPVSSVMREVLPQDLFPQTGHLSIILDAFHPTTKIPLRDGKRDTTQRISQDRFVRLAYHILLGHLYSLYILAMLIT